MNRLCVWCRHPWQVDAHPAPDCPGAEQGVCPGCRPGFASDSGTRALANVRDLPQPALAVDEEIRILAANRSACDLFGCDWPALRGRPLCDLLCPNPDSPRSTRLSLTECQDCPVHSLVNRTFEAEASGATALPARPALRGLGPGFSPQLVTSLWAGGVVALRIDPLADTA